MYVHACLGIARERIFVRRARSSVQLRLRLVGRGDKGFQRNNLDYFAVLQILANPTTNIEFPVESQPLPPSTRYAFLNLPRLLCTASARHRISNGTFCSAVPDVCCHFNEIGICSLSTLHVKTSTFWLCPPRRFPMTTCFLYWYPPLSRAGRTIFSRTLPVRVSLGIPTSPSRHLTIEDPKEFSDHHWFASRAISNTFSRLGLISERS